MAKIKRLGEQERTGQGFPIIDFWDIVNQACSLEASTLIDQDLPEAFDQPGTSAIWLGSTGQEMHLSRNQVKSLVVHLKKWLATGLFDY